MDSVRFNPVWLFIPVLMLAAASTILADDQQLPAPAGTPGVRISGPPSEFFNNLDRNHDGYITRDEVPPDSRLAQQWQRYDATGEGRIGPAEFSAFENGTGAINDDADQKPATR